MPMVFSLPSAFFEFTQERAFAGAEGGKFLLHFPDHALVVGL